MILLVNLIAGAFGANIAAGVAKHLNLGLFGNTLVGVLGGGVGGQVLTNFGFQGLAGSVASKDGLDTVALLTQAGATGASGAVALLLTSFASNLVVR
ncbi:MAG: hypothetical protein AAFN80_04975 [Pseudomonadota bacterium]